MSKALTKMLEPMFAAMAKRYQGYVGAELSKYGLRYDDLLDETANLDVAEALRRLPQEVGLYEL
jgi:ubiquinol-cytochrome c reductase subunit 7